MLQTDRKRKFHAELVKGSSSPVAANFACLLKSDPALTNCVIYLNKRVYELSEAGMYFSHFSSRRGVDVERLREDCGPVM